MKIIQLILLVSIFFVAASRPPPAARGFVGCPSGDFTERSVFAAAAQQRAADGELILLTLDDTYIDLAAVLVQNLESLGLRNYIAVSYTQAACVDLMAQYGVCCGWTSFLRHHRGWAAWGLGPGGAHSYKRKQTEIFTFKWYFSLIALEAGLNVLFLDSDVHLLADPYPLLRGSGPFSPFSMVVQVDLHQPAAARCVAASAPGQLCGHTAPEKPPLLNTGIFYIGGARPGSPLFRVLNATLGTILRRLDEGVAGPVPACGEACTVDALQILPSWDLLWEQHVFNAVLAEAAGTNWTVTALPAGPPQLWAPGGPLGPVAWVAMLPHTWPGVDSGAEFVAAAPDWLFTRLCSVGVLMLADEGVPSPLSEAPLLGSSVPNGTRLAKRWDDSAAARQQGGQPVGGGAREEWAARVDRIGYGVHTEECGNPNFVDPIAPLVVAHNVFTPNDVRRLTFRALGWMLLQRGAEPQLPQETPPEAGGSALTRGHVPLSLKLAAAHPLQCMGRNGTQGVLLSHYDSEHAFLCSAQRRDDGCACCVDVTSVYGSSNHPRFSGWAEIRVQGGWEQSDVQKTAAGCGAWWKRLRRR